MGYILVLVFSTCLIAKEYYPGKYFDGVRINENMGEIVVLEAPIFKSPELNSNVIFYFRKGDKINVHPAEFEVQKFQSIKNVTAKEVADYKTKFDKDFPDPLFTKKDSVYYPDQESKFYKVLLKSGRTGWILKEHIFLMTLDSRELTQTFPSHDPTDYRIEEPLPPNFPIKQKTGIRGYGSFGLGISRGANYPYTEDTKQVAYGFSKSLDISFLRNAREDRTRRLFFGGHINIFSSTSKYELETRSSSESQTTIGVGPTLVYDLWKTEKYILSTQGSFIFNFINFTTIKQKENNSNNSEEREFSSLSLTPKIGFIFTQKNVLDRFDIILGSYINMNLEQEYPAQESAKNSNWWQGDEYEKPNTVESSYFMGIQTDY